VSTLMQVVMITVVFQFIGFGLCKFRIELETKHCHLSVIHDDTQDHVCFKCMLHTFRWTLNMLEL
jgi:hypothetical protein